jgi:hypothetical protein
MTASRRWCAAAHFVALLGAAVGSDPSVSVRLWGAGDRSRRASRASSAVLADLLLRVLVDQLDAADVSGPERGEADTEGAGPAHADDRLIGVEEVPDQELQALVELNLADRHHAEDVS